MKFILEVDPDLDDTATARELLRFAIDAIGGGPLAWDIVNNEGFTIHSDVIDMSDRVLGPNDVRWIGYPRAQVPPTDAQFSDPYNEDKLDWLLRAVTTAGSDVNQRRYDLESIAKIITENPQAGYGRTPIDTDVHPEDCVICDGAEDFTMNPPGSARDGHPYVTDVTSVWVVSWVYYQGDEQGGGGHNWWPGDTDDEVIKTAFDEEVRGWETSTAMVRLTRLRVPAFGTDEKAREAITNWIDADTDRIESGPEADVVVYSYDGADDWRIFLERLIMLKGKLIDCAPDESAEIKAWMRTYPNDPLTVRLATTFPNEWDEVGAEQPDFVRLYEAIAACEAPPGTQIDDVLAAFHAAYTKQKEG